MRASNDTYLVRFYFKDLNLSTIRNFLNDYLSQKSGELARNSLNDYLSQKSREKDQIDLDTAFQSLRDGYIIEHFPWDDQGNPEGIFWGLSYIDRFSKPEYSSIIEISEKTKQYIKEKHKFNEYGYNRCIDGFETSQPTSEPDNKFCIGFKDFSIETIEKYIRYYIGNVTIDVNTDLGTKNLVLINQAMKNLENGIIYCGYEDFRKLESLDIFL